MDEIQQIANDVRTWAEEYAKANFFPSDLCGLCAKASGEIWRRLKKLGYTVTIVENFTRNHFFVKVNYEGLDYVVDVTATQFGLPFTVYIMDYREAQEFYPWWKRSDEYPTDKECLRAQVNSGWSDEQRIDIPDFDETAGTTIQTIELDEVSACL